MILYSNNNVILYSINNVIVFYSKKISIIILNSNNSLIIKFCKNKSNKRSVIL